MATPKKPNSTSNSVSSEVRNLDWVKDSAGNQKQVSLLAFMSKNERRIESLTAIPAKPAEGDKKASPARARFSYVEVNPQTGEEESHIMWASQEASEQINKHWNAQTKKFTKGALANLYVGEYYVTDMDTNERITDEEGNEVTSYRLIKGSGNTATVSSLAELM